MNDLPLVIAVTFVAVLVAGPLSEFLRRAIPVTEPMIAIAIGAIVGPAIGGWVTLDGIGDPHAILLEAARYTLGITVMSAALELPVQWLPKRWKSLAVTLGLGMPLMWVASAGIAIWLVGAPVWPALLLGAILTPTDPVLASSIVSDRRAVERVARDARFVVASESGANDGLALPFVGLSCLFVEGAAHPLHDFAMQDLGLEVGGGIAFGAAFGVAISLLSRIAVDERIERPVALLPVTITMAVGATGLGHAFGLDGILASFVAGVVFAAKQKPDINQIGAMFDPSSRRLFELPAFVLFGIGAPYAAWTEGGWPLLALGAAILFLRRFPAYMILGLIMPPIRGWAERAYIAWFGPIGIGAMFYALYAGERTGNWGYWDVASFVVILSAFAHGVSADPVSRNFPQRERRRQREDEV